MTTPLSVLRLFVASPNDVQRERKELVKVIDRLNRIFERVKSIRIQLVRWETDTYPGIGVDAQDVINAQLRDDYDIFVGILWRRLGTPTARGESGTVEEYERAREKYDANPGSVSIMWYFKESSTSKGSSEKSGQVRKVRKFREELGRNGVYYATFRSPAHFRDLVDQHLANYLCDLIAGRENVPSQNANALPDEIEPLILQVQTEADDFRTAAIEVSKAFLKLSGGWAETTARVERIVGENAEEADLPVIDAVLERLRSEFEDFAVQIEELCPRLGRAFNQFAWVSIRLFSIASRVEVPNVAFMLMFVQSQIQQFHAVTKEGISIHSRLQSMFAGSPYATPALNMARLRTTDALDLLLNEYRSIERANEEMLDLIETILGRRGAR